MTTCKDCGTKHKAMGERCQKCKTINKKNLKEALKKGWIIGAAGGAWWVWDMKGNVLSQGATKQEALENVP
ncbi:MAG: hypothetical protein AAB922_06675 [Patescibacteria group bacterium]